MPERVENVTLNEIETLKAAKRQQDLKLQLLKERYKEDVSVFSEARVEQIFKNSGAREYIERLKERTKVKDDIISHLKEDLEFKNKEIAELEDKCKKIEFAKAEYLRHWKEAQSARERLEAELKSSLSVKEQRRSTGRHHNMSSTSSVVENQVPPPPAIDVPSIEEILRSAPSSQGADLYQSLDSSIPPPPMVEVPIDELIKCSENPKRELAFKQEQGEFVCHVYAVLNIDSNTEVLTDIIELVEAEQSRSSDGAYRGWTNVGSEIDDNGSSHSNQYHVTLIRGHRVIYHHQIAPLLDSMGSEIKRLNAFRVCLDKLRLFYNHENTTQFLCLASRETSQAMEILCLKEIKHRLRAILNQFAMRKTEEDESDDTLAHCSLMRRDVQQVQQQTDADEDLSEIEKLCYDNLPDYPICFVQVDTIHIKIGCRVYSFDLEKGPVN